RALSGVEVQRMLAQRAGDPQAGLLPVVFTSMLGEARAELCGERPEQHVEVLYSITETPQTWLDNKVYEIGSPRQGHAEALAIDRDAPEALFPPGLLDAMFGAYVDLIEALGAEDEHAWTHTGRSLVPSTDRSLIAAANATAGPCPEELLHEPVFAAADAQPEAVALIGVHTRLSYGELRARALALAHELQAHLEPADRLVAIVMEKGVEQVVVQLAVLVTGRAVLPFSAGQHDARIQAILAQSGARIALIQSRLRRDRNWRRQVALIEVPENAPAQCP